MRRSYKFRLRPTARQEQALNACLEDHRVLYNAALEERRTAWRRCGVSISYGNQSAQLKEIRSTCPWQARWSFSSQQATLRRLNRAFGAFFRRVKAGQKPGYPRFKGNGWFDTLEWPKDGDGCRWKPDAKRVYLHGIGEVRVHAHRRVNGVVKTISVKREGRRWHLILSCDQVPARPLPATGAVVGIDMGVTHFLTTSDGAHVANPRHLRRSAAGLAAAQREADALKAKPGQRSSRRHRRAKERVARLHAKVARQRLDFHHKVALDLVRAYDVICREDLAIINMSRSASGTAKSPGTNVAAKSGLNRSILDAAWGQFFAVLASAAESATKAVLAVDPAHTSRLHHACGQRGVRHGEAFRCPHCSVDEHADTNAARNILRAGLARQVAPAA